MNLVLRAVIGGVLVDARRRPDNTRYAGKGIGTRGLVVLPASLLVPAVWALRGRGTRYPVWTDDLNLSIYALDMVGNYLDLYDRFTYFDVIPHAHGTGAATWVVADLFDLPALSAVGVAQLVHVGLEAQEYYSDVLFDLRNVRGTWDTVNDLLAGAIGSVTYAWLRRGALGR
ncbi:MAG: hypothetical protein ACRDFY_11085 [Candidatus Limnocylindria bacterium]